MHDKENKERKQRKSVKRSPTEQEKTFENHLSNKGLIALRYQQFKKLNMDHQPTQLNKEAKDLNRQCSKGKIKWPTNVWGKKNLNISSL